MAAGVADGTTVTFGTSGFAAQIKSVDGPNPTRGFVESSHLGSSGAKTFLASNLYDAGEVTMTVNHDAALTVPITGAAETITIDWGGSGNTWSFSGFMTGYSPSASGLDEIMEATITLKATGAITGI